MNKERYRANEAELDGRVRDALATHGATAAATIVIQQLGAELLGYLWLAAGSWGDGDELFSQVCERIWRSLPRFRFECSVRTWAYVVARNRVRSGFDSAKRHPRAAPLELAESIAAVQTTTLLWLKSETKLRFEQLREALDEDDRTVLVLRVDRRMRWNDIAMVMRDPDEPLERAAARLRKRFERVKLRVRNELVPDARRDE